VSRVQPWSGDEVESRATVSQVVVDDRCRQSVTSARSAVVDPRQAKQQARWRAPRWSDIQGAVEPPGGAVGPPIFV
jgi:hypothetical protein